VVFAIPYCQRHYYDGGYGGRLVDASLGSLHLYWDLCPRPDCIDSHAGALQLDSPFDAMHCGCHIACIFSEDEMTMTANTY
jgi:hypothetical protein